jgi:hypothetical protein
LLKHLHCGSEPLERENHRTQTRHSTKEIIKVLVQNGLQAFFCFSFLWLEKFRLKRVVWYWREVSGAYGGYFSRTNFG